MAPTWMPVALSQESGDSQGSWADAMLVNHEELEEELRDSEGEEAASENAAPDTDVIVSYDLDSE